MPGKSPKTQYGEFRHFAEWQSGGRVRIKRDLLPPMAAWLLMLANRYQKAAEQMEHKFVTEGIPGMKECAQRMRFAVEHLHWLMDALTTSFQRGDWAPAVVSVCELMHIHGESIPIMDIPDGQFSPLIPVADGDPEQSAVGADVQLCVAEGARGETGQRDATKGRSRRAGKASLGSAPGTAEHHLPKRSRRGRASNRSD